MDALTLGSLTRAVGDARKVIDKIADTEARRLLYLCHTMACRGVAFYSLMRRLETDYPNQSDADFRKTVEDFLMRHP